MQLQEFQLSTPGFIMNVEEFRKGIMSFKHSLNEHFKQNEIAYSVKTNSLPYALKEAKKYGCKAEVVSHDEYNLAILCGYKPNEIIYNGPMKSEETFLNAIKNGAIVNIETKRELEWLKMLPLKNIYNVGIRLNINISRVSPEDAESEDDNSRFGFSDDSDEFNKAIKLIESLPNIKLAGLHIHRTAHSRSPRFYEKSVDYAARIIKKYSLNLEYLDVGGGYFGIFYDKPTFQDYSKAIYNSLIKYKLENLKIIVEPGNALTAACFSFVTEVIDIKKVDDKTCFVTTDGSRNDIDPFFRKHDYLKEIIYQDLNRQVEPLQIISGCSCLEYDRLFVLRNSKALEVGDRIVYNNVGAYTMTLSPLFIRLFPKVYALKLDGSLILIRNNWDAKDLIQKDLI